MPDWMFFPLACLAALGQPGLVVVFYNAVLSRLHESALKKATALAALPGGWIAAAVIVAGAAAGRGPEWFLYQGHGAGDAILSAYLFASLAGGVAVIGLIVSNPRRRPRPAAERSNHTHVVSLPRRGPYPYGPLKRAFLHLTAPVNELTRVEVVTKEIELPHLPPAFDGFRLLQLSDFHIDRALEDDFFRAVVRLANEQKPDVVVMTGDYVSRARHIERIAALLGGLQARRGVFYVRGNHDFWTRPTDVRRALDSLGYQCLDSRAVVLREETSEQRKRKAGPAGDSEKEARVDARAEPQGDAIAMVGIEHPYDRKPARWIDLFSSDLPACRIALMHTPDVIGPVSRMGCDLALAGHTHGGQVQLPFVGATLVPSSYGRRYAAGWRRVGRTLLYANRGIGAFFPLRFLCPPEITVLILRAPSRREAARRTPAR